MSTIYKDGTYLSKNPGWHEADSSWKAEKIENALERNSLRPKTICEVGCGAGEILNCLSRSFPDREFFGYEISPQAFDICKKKANVNLTFRFEDLLEAPKNISFDVLLIIDVVEHIEDYFSFLRGIKKRGLYKIFHIPLDLSVQMVLREHPILRVRKELGHIHYFTKNIALESLREAGYVILDHFYTGGSVELPNRSWRAKLLKIPRKLAFPISRDLTARIFGGYSLMILAE